MEHIYEVKGRRVPSVTQIIGELLPQWQADDWYLGRGTAVHACCAMIARGEAFTHDPQIDGQVRAARKWYVDFSPDVFEVETPRVSERFQFGGTPDLVASVNNRRTIVDFKATMTPATPYQLAGYAELVGDINVVMGVELREDGTYKVSGLLGLRMLRREFLALRACYGIRERLGMLSQGETEEG